MNVLEKFEKIRELELETHRYLVAQFHMTVEDNGVNSRATIFTDHDNYFIRIDYSINGNDRTLKFEVPFWKITCGSDLLEGVTQALSEDIAKLLTKRIFFDNIEKFDISSVRLQSKNNYEQH
jgi:hypothetical protein